MSKTIATENAPAAIGPYVQGVDLGNMIITSGQIPVNPKTGEVPADVAAQARQSLDNCLMRYAYQAYVIPAIY